MARLLALVLAGWLVLAPAAGADAPALAPGQFTWAPGLAPEGPLLVLVSLPRQRATVYRNGVRIGESTVSTGRKGYETPTGVFTILQKKREHFSNLYDDAPMPYMQRLSWSGLALHAGRVPGYPASHGCVRLPEAFAAHLFEVTSRGMTVVITDTPEPAPLLADPALFPPPPPPARLGTPARDPALPAPPDAPWTWNPGLAPEGALTLVLSTADQALVVLRQGVVLGRGPVAITGPRLPGTRAWVLLAGERPDAAPVLPGRPRRPWLQVLGGQGEDPSAAFAGAAVAIDPGFLARVYDLLAPGATLVVTDEPLGPVAGLTVLQAGDENPSDGPQTGQD